MLHRENKVKQYHTSSAADLLKEVMDYYDITQADLAKRIGVSQKNISDILNRKRYLTAVLAIRIEKVMGISSKLLLSLDSNYKLQLAKKDSNTANKEASSPLFLQRYSWVTA
ncbi:HigA family addiction module antidote protein [Limosilactobacillus sp. STM2_1]|uniref:HigA family addiction module antidote protein n=1 Tax=Limosilactobacillus rudii TaxID=2759755 RepID=A0A7W3UJF9_9LACO|nr:HigA family addiction module antitoxin [Limosilactobacillus rudii]MBB1078491.1 HigA family addiction module antidote protein [Limosilactobacillus rudii]MBB1096621.1 HigA family addiction module antidote protein [Limosilactobacillus rudii]MCD7134184.1 HigA family addiction module antitoxin [Limosilactobacillus rudii]